MFKNLVHVEFPRLREVRSGSSVTFSNNLIPELHLPRLEPVNASLFIGENSVLNDVGLPRLTYAKDLTVRQNPRLLNFTADVARRIDQVFLEGNFTNVEFFSLREVTGDFKVIGAPSMDCYWFDQNFFQKIFKGSYQCVGNLTTPDVPRRPSTSTDLGKLNDDAEGVATSNGGLSTGAKAGIGVSAALGTIALLTLGLFVWRKKRRSAEGTQSQTGFGLGKSELDATAVAKSRDDGGHGGRDTHPELDSSSFRGIEADSRVVSPTAELDPSPRGQAGTREELDGAVARRELSSGDARLTAELPGVCNVVALKHYN